MSLDAGAGRREELENYAANTYGHAGHAMAVRELLNEVAQLERERDEIAYRVEHPESAHLHYSDCPYKPWAEVPHDPDDLPIPECTCGEREKAAYWKGQYIMERGYHTLTKQKLTAATERIGALQRALVEADTLIRPISIKRYAAWQAWRGRYDALLAEALDAIQAARP